MQEEGIDALKLFDVDMEKKLKHWQEEIALFAGDKDYPHSKPINEIENI